MQKLLLCWALAAVLLFAQSNGKKFERKNLDRNSSFHYLGTGNIDHDSQKEILFLSNEYNTMHKAIYYVYAIDGSSGDVEWQSEDFSSIVSYKSEKGKRIYEIHFDDIDQDNMQEVIIMGTAKMDNRKKIHTYDAN